MFKLVFFCALLVTLSSFPILKNKQKIIFITNTIVTTTSTTTTTITPSNSSPAIIHPQTTLEQLTNFFHSLYPILVLVLPILSGLVFYIIKCYRNACTCKLSWFTIKSIDEQRRRRELQQQRQRALDELIARSSAENVLI